METTAEYYNKMTDKKIFECRNIEFRNGQYVAVNPVTEERAEQMKRAMTRKDAQQFDDYMYKYFSLQSEVRV